MQNLWWLLLVLACPLMMIFMMRGMVGGHGGHTSSPAGSAVPGTDEERDRRIAELERENVALRKQVPGARAGHAAHDVVGHDTVGRDGASG